MKANEILDQAVECIADRGARYNTGEERSMGAAVKAFNAITGRDLSESDGWLLMVQIKLARERGSPYDPDHTVDCSAYAALYGESRLRGAVRAAEGQVRFDGWFERNGEEAAESATPRTYKGWDYQP